MARTEAPLERGFACVVGTEASEHRAGAVQSVFGLTIHGPFESAENAEGLAPLAPFRSSSRITCSSTPISRRGDRGSQPAADDG